MAKYIDLTGKIAVVTGAGSGIGRATAQLLARHGAQVHVADLNAEAAADVARQIGSRAVHHSVDVTDPDALEALAEAVYGADGRVDILHNNAGVGHGGDIEATTIEDWQRIIGVNLLGVAYGVQAFVPRMLHQGVGAKIVNTASVAGLVPTAKMVPYCTSKFGVVGMSESLDAELKPRGIRVMALCPGVIDTAIVRGTVMRGAMAAEKEKIVGFYANRGTSPEVVAQAALGAIARPRLIIPTPRSQVVAPYLLHRLSPALTGTLSRYITRFISR